MHNAICNVTPTRIGTFCPPQVQTCDESEEIVILDACSQTSGDALLHRTPDCAPESGTGGSATCRLTHPSGREAGQFDACRLHRFHYFRMTASGLYICVGLTLLLANGATAQITSQLTSPQLSEQKQVRVP